MGLDEFSMSAASILKVKKIIGSVETQFAEKVRDAVFELESAADIENYLKNILQDIGLDYLLTI